MKRFVLHRPRLLSRRYFLGMGALAAASAPLLGCTPWPLFGRDENVPDATVRSIEEAIELALVELEKRHRESFLHVDTDRFQSYVPSEGQLNYAFCLAPTGSSENYFSAELYTDEGTDEVISPVYSNYSQWLFKGPAEAPFREILAADSSVVGYATRMTYTRMDDRLWRSEELERYMGKGGRRDPRIDAIAFVEEGISIDDAAEVAKRLQAAIWDIKRSSTLIVAAKGTNPFKVPFYQTYTKKEVLASRGEPPTDEEIEDQVQYFMTKPKFDKDFLWDGLSNTIGDPDAEAFPIVVWKE